MDYDRHVDAVQRELVAFVAALRAGDPSARVPTCPDFSLDDLGEHVGTLLAFWTHVLCEGTGRAKPPAEPLGAGEHRADWVAAIGDHLVAELLATPAGTTVWTWYEPDQSAGFVGRRMSHELAIHRVDAQLAATGAAEPVDAALAVDGIDEVLVLIERPGQEPGPGWEGQTIHLHGTDVADAEWLITLDRSGIHVAREHAKGDLAVRGSVSDLEMVLYQRPTTGEVQRFGDDSVLDVFFAAFTF